MPEETPTQILEDLANGEPGASERLFPLVYDQLRRIASAQMRAPRDRITLQPTAVVHEAYLKIVGSGRDEWRGRAHFLAAAAKAVRHVLIDAARARQREKRGGGARPVTLLEGVTDATPVLATPIDIFDLDEALEKLAEVSPRLAQLVELRYFGGLTLAEMVEATGHARSTVTSDLAMARAWLHARLEEKTS